MKHFLKRVNRGIVLGAVLLIGLAVFIWQDELAFQKETPAIERTVTEYLETCAKANVFDTGLQKIGAAMTQQQQSDKLQEFNKILDRYWTETDSNRGMGKSTLAGQLKDAVSENSKGKGYIQKCTVKLDEAPKVTKSGPGSATVEISFTFTIEYAGIPSYFVGYYPSSVDRMSGKEPNAGEAADPTRKRMTSNIGFQVEMEKSGSAWKIASLGSGSGSGGQTVNID